jgi:integrase
MNSESKLSVITWMEKWLQTYVRPNLAYKTYSSYSTVINILKTHFPELKDIPINELNTFQAQQIINNLADKFARSTLCTLRVVLHESYDYAEGIPYLNTHPLGKLMIPKSAKVRKVRAMTKPEQEAVEDVAQTALLGYIAIFFLRTGLRSGELCLLDWEDYNSQNQTIHIRKSKTKAGIRFVPLCEDAQKILLSQRKQPYDNAIFHSSNGHRVTSTVLKKLALRLRQKSGVPFLTTHVYRHTFATRALEDGMNVKALSRILGHTNVAFTMQRYCTPDVNFLREQMDMLDQVRKNKQNKL